MEIHERLRQRKALKTADELAMATWLELGHITSSNLLQTMLVEGIKPSEATGKAINDGTLSSETGVYLASHYDRLYADRAVEAHGGEPVLLTVRVDRTNLIADPNYLLPNVHHESDLEALFDSLCAGSCIHRGPVPASQILRCRGVDGLIMPRA